MSNSPSICRLFLPFLACTGLYFAVADGASAQTQNVDRAQMTQSQNDSLSSFGTGFEGDHAVSSPNDSDLGEQEILKREDRYQPFTVTAGVPGFFTSNAALSRTDEKSDFLVAPSVGIFYEPRITNTLYGLIDVREQLFYYDRFDELNFGAFDVDVGLNYVLPQMENLTLRAAYNYNRLTERDSFDDFFSNHAFIFSAEVPVRFGRAQQLSFGTGGNISIAAAQENPRRNDYEAYVAYSLGLTRAFYINAVGRLVLRDYYHQDSRVDVSEILGVTASYRVTKYFTASAISSLAANQSNHDFFDYKVGNVGGALSLSVKF